MAPVLLRDEATGQRETIAETWYHLHTRGTFYTVKYTATLCSART
jgi:hypothetical protein